MRFDVLTLFPAMLEGFLAESMVGKSIQRGIVEAAVHNLRDWTTDKHQITDDRPFGGGAGMVMKPEPIFSAIEELRSEQSTVIYLAPDGEQLSHSLVMELAAKPHLILLSGHYEGIDERVRENLIDREISIGDYVLTNGTLPAAVLIDAVARQLPGVLGEAQSLEQDSFSDGLLGLPQYTRPAEFRGMKIPEVLLSGNHAKIEAWRQEQRRARTAKRRPDLL
ncbi:tRNA (guanosine(37)-N1)-methyltransferase TrmD [Puniceicoccus vermicola]|uniref:tRNA (guanine-N(1)-)-methyltransferase n=1 Tax=Puniceicoccus vermicola TaxID=388746 RepID=A0A7X1E4L4_9BACT|nr:tRNA (guanosine(37)-N1)-methyltransferase TrmD [Puniceicoccus vermicola]MBC2602179.1 tRNA (guanosine(37)-N1)-methyltransferase TrmD [Puniceicoccus vermicola]